MTQDITQLIIKDTKNKLAKVKPVANQNFMPQIPDNKITNQLPPEVIAALDSTQRQSTAMKAKERGRTMAELNYSQVANMEIGDAEKRISEIKASPFLEYQGLFNDEYSIDYQNGLIKQTQRKLQMKNLELEAERKLDRLNLEKAALPLENYKLKNTLQKDAMALSVAQNTAIIQSNSARAATLKMLQSNLSNDEIMSADTNKSYTEVMTPEFVKGYKEDLKSFNMDMETKELAIQNNRFDLSQKIEERAFKSVPMPWLKTAVDAADLQGSAVITIPGTKITVATDRARNELALKTKAQDDSFAAIAAQQTKLVQNNAVMSSALSNIGNASSVYTSGTPEVSSLANMGSLNMLNITDQTITEFPFDSLAPSLRAPTMDFMQATANLNEAQKTGSTITSQMIADRDAKIKIADDIAVKLGKQQVESVSKMAKPAIKEWTTFGAINDQNNAAGIVTANTLTIPDFGGDLGLRALAAVYQENISSEIAGDNEDIDAIEDPVKRQAAYLKLLAGSGFQSKITSRDEVLKAMNKPNKDGITPVDAYTQTKIASLMFDGMQEMMNKYPEYAGYFSALGAETKFENPAKLAMALTALSMKIQESNPNAPDMSLSQELLTIMNLNLEKSKSVWDAQINPVRGGFMKTAFNGSPTGLVDTQLSMVYGSVVRDSWTKLSAERAQLQVQKLVSDKNYNPASAGATLLANRLKDFNLANAPTTPLPTVPQFGAQ